MIKTETFQEPTTSLHWQIHTMRCLCCTQTSTTVTSLSRWPST